LPYPVYACSLGLCGAVEQKKVMPSSPNSPKPPELLVPK